jgi:hypothetical protein
VRARALDSGTVGGLFEEAAAAASTVAVTVSAVASGDDVSASKGIKEAPARRRLGGVPTPSKQEVEVAFAKYGVSACGCVKEELCLCDHVAPPLIAVLPVPMAIAGRRGLVTDE